MVSSTQITVVKALTTLELSGINGKGESDKNTSSNLKRWWIYHLISDIYASMLGGVGWCAPVNEGGIPCRCWEEPSF